MLHMQQILILVPMLQVNMPASCNFIFSIIFQIAAFDFIETGDYFEEYFETAPSEPFNENFEAIGLETTYFIHNMGTLMFTLVALPVILLVLWLTYLLRDSHACFLRVNNFIGGYFRWNSTIRVLMENYGLISLVSMLGLRHLEWSTPGSQINSALACASPLYMIGVPAWAAYHFYRNFDRLGEPGQLEMYGSFYEELHLGSKKWFAFVATPLFFFVRRIILAATIVFFDQRFFNQIFPLLALSIVALALQISNRPYQATFRHNIELYNEFTLIICLYHMFMFTEFEQNWLSRSIAGFSIVWIIVVHAIVNIVLILVFSIKESRKNHRERSAKLHAKKELDAQIVKRRLERKTDKMKSLFKHKRSAQMLEGRLFQMKKSDGV